MQAHSISPAEAEQAMQNDPLLQYEQQAGDEERELYYGETSQGRMLAVCVTFRRNKIRVITAYDLDAGQIRDYLDQRMESSNVDEQDDDER